MTISEEEGQKMGDGTEVGTGDQETENGDQETENGDQVRQMEMRIRVTNK